MEMRPNTTRRAAAMDARSAELLAVETLGHVAAYPALLSRFLAISGIEPEHVREAAREPGFLAGILDFVVAHEPTLLAAAAALGRDPSDFLAARRALPTGDDRYERST